MSTLHYNVINVILMYATATL
eukprot:COSAG06_NODE_62919_length_263_cov_1.871951_1_plen_20_part_10